MKLFYNKLYIALFVSVLVHGLLLFQYSMNDVEINEEDSQPAVVRVELIPHVVESPAKIISKSVAVVRHESVAEPMAVRNESTRQVPVDVSEQPAQTVSESDSNHEQFVSLLYQAIDKRKRYPYLAKRQRREGMVKLQFVVHPDGQVTDVSVIESSRFNVLDDAAREAVNAISPFMLASNYISEQKIFDVDIDFRLN